MRRLLIIPLALLALLALAMFWSGGAGVEQSADFRFINRGETTTLDPARISWLQDVRLAYALWEGLYTPDPQTLKPVPGVAESHELSDDKTVYTFHLRESARWSNGDPVTAGDFLFAWRRMLENPDEYTSLFHYIRGARDYQEAYARDPSSADFSKVGIEALDSRTLRVTLKHPVLFFLELAAFTPFVPLHEPSMRPFAQKEQNGHVTHDEQFTHPPNLVSNGPYRLEKWQFKRRVRLVANEHYWNRATVKSRIIDQISAEDPQTAYLMYHTGAVEWLSDVTPAIGAELRAANHPDLRIFPGFGTYFYSVNCQPTLHDGRKNPFADVRVRQAFAMALEKTPIVETITRMGEKTALNYVSPGIFQGYVAPPGLQYDVERARALLAEAGYPDGRGFPAVTLLFNTGVHHGDVAQIARRQWANNLGIDVELEGVEVQIFRSRLNQKQYVLARASWIGDYNDPTTFTDKYRSFSDGNDAGWINAEYDSLCESAAIEIDPAKRLALLAQAESILNREVPIIPIYYYNNAYLFRDNVRGIPLHPKQMNLFQSIEVSR